jgi:hypothetical protein
VQRIILALAGMALAALLIWCAGTDLGLRDFVLPLPGTMGKGQAILLLMAALVVIGTLIGLRAPFATAVIELDDTGLTTRFLGAGATQPAFVPYGLLDRVEVMPLRSDHRLTITARAPAERRWFQIRCAAMTGEPAPEIAREIARRAKAAGVVVTGPEPGRAMAFESIWTFSPAPGDQG